jgi:hemoglobin-like flavoprotein
MSPESERLVRQSWERINPKSDAVVASFYSKLFAQSPEAASLFGSTEMETQRRKFAVMLHEIVRVLDQPQLLVSEVADSGRRHAGYGVLDRHYAPVGVALLSAISEALGPDATPEVISAWREAYDLLAAVMRRAASTVTH